MPGDTGNYTCVPTVAKTSSVYVHVIIGEYKQPHVNVCVCVSVSGRCVNCCVCLTVLHVYDRKLPVSSAHCNFSPAAKGAGRGVAKCSSTLYARMCVCACVCV